MYLPKAFEQRDPATLHAFVRAHSFATLVSCVPGEGGRAVPFATHLPLLLDTGRGPYGVLRGHMARANPQWRSFATGGELLAVFLGPHAPVSSTWYRDPERQVPTWNYAAVHVYGNPGLVEGEEEILSLMRDTVAVYQPEGHPMPLDPPAELARELVREVAAFEIEISRWEGKWKLSQNKPAEDRERVRAGLQARGGEADRAVAELMKRPPT